MAYVNFGAPVTVGQTLEPIDKYFTERLHEIEILTHVGVLIPILANVRLSIPTLNAQ